MGSPACNTDGALYTNTRSLKRLVINEGIGPSCTCKCGSFQATQVMPWNFICILNLLRRVFFLCRVVINCPSVNSLCPEFLKESVVLTSVFKISVSAVLCYIFTEKHTPLFKAAFEARSNPNLEPLKRLLSFRTIEVPRDLHALTRNKCRIAVDNPLSLVKED